MIYHKEERKVSSKITLEEITLNAITLFPAWRGQTAVCIAGGASLTKEQVDAAIADNCRIIAINDAYKLAPDADILYACDFKWWEWHKGCPDFKGYKLQHYPEARLNNMSIALPYPDIDAFLSSGNGGFEERMDRQRHGGNSGYQALHIAMQLGASKIILIGYDMGVNSDKTHWFGEHPGQSPNANNQKYENWIQEFPALKEAADKRGQRIINATIKTRLKCFEQMTIEEALNA